MDPLFLAYSRMRRRRFDDAVELCDSILGRQDLPDVGAWFIKCRALTQKMDIDEDAALDEVGMGDALLESTRTAQTPRPGTSLSAGIGRPGTGSSNYSAGNPAVRPLTGAGRPLTGFARPGTSQQGAGVSAMGMPGTARPVTSRPISTASGSAGGAGSAGRFVRLGTASLKQALVDTTRLDFAKYAGKPAIAKALVEYLMVHDRNARAALELASHATQASMFNDWWWKSRLGRCYLLLGLYRDAEKQFRSALKQQDMSVLYGDLARVYLRLDQPKAAIDCYRKGQELHAADLRLVLGEARVNDALGLVDDAAVLYKRVLDADPGNIEAIANMAAHYFYSDAPEVSIKLYQRLLLMGVAGADLWNNLGLSCFHASQYDMALGCFERALQQNDQSVEADVWYNLGMVYIGIGDQTLAYQAFKVACACDPAHTESFVNLGVLESRKGDREAARRCFEQAIDLAEDYCYEAHYNLALLAFRTGDFDEAYRRVQRSLAIFADHPESVQLYDNVKGHFTVL